MLTKKESKTTFFVKTEDSTFEAGHIKIHPKFLFSVSMCMQQQCTWEKPQPTLIQQLIDYQKLPQATINSHKVFLYTFVTNCACIQWTNTIIPVYLKSCVQKCCICNWTNWLQVLWLIVLTSFKSFKTSSLLVDTSRVFIRLILSIKLQLTLPIAKWFSISSDKRERERPGVYKRKRRLSKIIS